MNDLPLPPSDIIDYITKGYADYNVKVNEVECLVILGEHLQFVIPRGTEFSGFFSEGGWRDVIRDIRAFPWFSKRLGGFSHAGFYKGARGIVDKGLFGMLRRELPTYFLGHSLGGALTLNCAAILHKAGFNVAGVITLGSPRTFTKGLARKVNNMGFPIWQFSNPGDPIPDVPFKIWRYRHCNEIHTDRERRGYSISKNHMMPHYKDALIREEI